MLQKERGGPVSTSNHFESNSEQPSQPSQLASTERAVAVKSQAVLDQQNVEVIQENDEEIEQEGQGLPHSEVQEAEQNRVARVNR